jgi:SAM-dependent methyltransferase
VRSSSSPWNAPGTVAGFAQASPNERLMDIAARELRRSERGLALDLGCGAGRNAVPLAELGWDVIGLDLSWPMLTAAADRRLRLKADDRSRLYLLAASMHAIPARDACFDFIVAHGIWNLARSSGDFRQAVGEAARVARPGAELFVFTFSRNTFPADVQPVPGEPFVFTQFSGEPQCFLTEDQLVSELRMAGFAPDPDVPIREYNRTRPRTLNAGGPPVIYEGGFRFVG